MWPGTTASGRFWKSKKKGVEICGWKSLASMYLLLTLAIHTRMCDFVIVLLCIYITMCVFIVYLYLYTQILND